MPISFDNALGVHQNALLIRAQRAEILANNIANADTPNFKARDIDFRSMLSGQNSERASEALQMVTTRSGHASGIMNPDFAADLMYRQSLQPSIDGNTVDVQIEQAEYARNAIDFQTSFTLLNKKFADLTKALTGN